MWNFIVGIIGNLVASLIVVGVNWLLKHGNPKQISALQWKLSGDVWWLACDLHTVKMQPMLNNPQKVPTAITQAEKHAQRIGADDGMLSRIEALRTINPTDARKLQEAVDPIIASFGKLAELNQPDFKP